MGHTLAVDLGGTNMRVAVVDREGTVLDRAQEPTPHHARSIEPFVGFVRAMRDAHDVEHAVVAVPGRVDYEAGRLLDGPHLPADWPPVLPRDALADALALPVALANDADVATIGEARFGAARGHDDVVYVTVSTGVGAGIVVGGHLLRPRYSAGEVGRSVVDRVLAAAGEDGTVEGLGSGTALARAAHAAGLDAAGPDRVRLDQGEGILVSFGSVASPVQKASLRESFGAQAVDMEGAAVARAAESRGAGFGVVKVISDEFDFSFPSMERFIDASGQFLQGRFAWFTALRPWLWPQVARLAGNSNRASLALCDWLGNMINAMPASAHVAPTGATNRR